MASSTQVLPSIAQKEEPTEFNEEALRKQIKEIEEANTEDEYETRLNGIGNTVAKWMKFIFNRDFGKEEFKAEWLSTDEYKTIAEECRRTAWRIITLPNWTVEKKGTQKGDVVESKQTEFGKVYRFTGKVDCPAKFLYHEFKHNITRLPEWNPAILKSDIIKTIDDGIELKYQVSAGGGRNIVAPRDFVILRRTAMLDKDGELAETDPYAYINSAVSIKVPGYPPVRDMVRADNKVGCWLVKPKTVTTSGKTEEYVEFQWLMCCDLKGHIPQFIVDAAFVTVMFDFVKHLRKFVSDSKAQHGF